jgi:hypothetical protein
VACNLRLRATALALLCLLGMIASGDAFAECSAVTGGQRCDFESEAVAYANTYGAGHSRSTTNCTIGRTYSANKQIQFAYNSSPIGWKGVAPNGHTGNYGCIGGSMTSFGIVVSWINNGSPCSRPAGDLITEGPNLSGLPVGTKGCDLGSNCRTNVESRDTIQIGFNSYSSVKIVTTGETCQAGEPNVETQKDQVDQTDQPICDMQGTLRVCVKKGETCATTSSGRTMCWPNGNTDQQCAQGSTDAVCKSPMPPTQPPPQEQQREPWEPQQNPDRNVTINNNTTYVNNYTNRPSPPPNKQPVCPPGQPNCEDDNDDDRISASDSGCETQTPSCSDTSAVDCQILYRTHRTKCEVAHTNKLIEQLEKKQVAESRETNAKLAEMLHKAGIYAYDGSEAARKNLEQLLSANASLSGISTKIDGSADRTVNALEDIKDAIEGNTNGSGNGSAAQNCSAAPQCTAGTVECAHLLQQWFLHCQAENAASSRHSQLMDKLSEESEGDGETQAHRDAATVTGRDGGMGDLDSDGFFSGGAGSCPNLPQFTIGGHDVDMSGASSVWCSFLAMLRVMFVLVGGIASFRILAGK